MRLAISMCATELAGGHANYSDISSTCRLIPLVGDLPWKLNCPPLDQEEPRTFSARVNIAYQ